MGHKDDIWNLNDVKNPIQFFGVGTICLPLVEGNIVFHVTSMTFQPLQMKGMY